MKLEHSFTVPVGIEQAWQILLDIERIGPCMPGAAIDSVTGDDFTGSVKVKLGPIGLTYKGKASFVEKDDTAHRAVIDARGKDARGNGTARALVTATLSAAGTATLVRVDTDLDITGKPAQFGRGVMVDVGNKLIGQFADNLAETIGSGQNGAVTTGDATTPADDDSSTAAAKKATPAAKRAAPAAKKAPAKKAPAAKKAAAKRPAPRRASTPDDVPTTTTIAVASPPNEVPAAAVDVPEVPTPPRRPIQREVEPINLIESAGPAVAKRLAPPALVLFVLIVLVRRRRRRRVNH